MILKYILYYKKNTGTLMIKIIITLLPDLEDGIVALFMYTFGCVWIYVYLY